jgi:hypothetical protein
LLWFVLIKPRKSQFTLESTNVPYQQTSSDHSAGITDQTGKLTVPKYAVVAMSLFVGVPLGNLGRGSVYKELGEIVEGGLRKWIISLYGSTVRGTWRRTRRPWRCAPLSMEALLGNLGEGSYAEGLCVEDGSGTVVSPYRGPVGEPGTGGSVHREL